jgi:cytidine deaminase
VADQNVVSVVALEILPGRESEFLALTGRLQGTVRRKGYGTNQLLRDGEHPGRYYDIRIWRNAEKAAHAEKDREIGDLRRDLGKYLKSAPVVDVAWAVEVGLASAGPWVERRSLGERRQMADRRARAIAFVDENRRRTSDRRGEQRRTIDTWEAQVVEAATIARAHAHATFSDFKVGAALQTSDGHIITGCNIENSTYGLTMCAERVAVFKAISDGHRSFRRMAVVADTTQPTTPCGACRQIIWEYAGNIEIVLADLSAVTSRHQLKDLLPHPFDARFIE